MASNTYTAVAANQHNISIYDAVSGSYIASINVTSGQIIGQPIIAGDKINVTFTEKGSTYLSVYDAKSFSFIRKQSLS